MLPCMFIMQSVTSLNDILPFFKYRLLSFLPVLQIIRIMKRNYTISFTWLACMLPSYHRNIHSLFQLRLHIITRPLTTYPTSKLDIASSPGHSHVFKPDILPSFNVVTLLTETKINILAFCSLVPRPSRSPCFPIFCMQY